MDNECELLVLLVSLSVYTLYKDVTYIHTNRGLVFRSQCQGLSYMFVLGTKPNLYYFVIQLDYFCKLVRL